ncbi:sterol desaturase [Auricularia subglabra TFB-10046 SS5]|nr:sterol desaturase [Auricularia subglabra TFB-10046 SS5]
MFDLAERWAAIVERYDPSTIDFWGVQIVMLIFYWLFATCFVLTDLWFPNFSARHKLQARDKQPTRKEFMECLRLVSLNQVLATAVLWLGGRVSGTPGWPGEFKFSPKLPTLWELTRDMVVCTLLREVLFYYAHRAFHHRAFYARFHKPHHRFTAPIAFASQYAHPVEHYIANYLPTALPPQLLRVHVVSWWVYLAAQYIETTAIHSGYDVFSGLARMHDLHHEKSTGNFGTLGILDWIHGTLRMDSDGHTARKVD